MTDTFLTAEEYVPFPAVDADLSDRDLALLACYESIVMEFGPWSKPSAHYVDRALDATPCSRCVLFVEGRCALVDGEIAPEASCRFAIGRPNLAKAVELPTVVKKSGAPQRFTLAPWYVPGALDAHGEFTTPDELQKALWSYVRKNDRSIRLQHDTSIVAGEWLEAVTWPFPVTVPMQKASGGSTEVDFPANTAFLGVQWEPWAWDLIQDGRITGLSIGGRSRRLTVDLPPPE